LSGGYPRAGRRDFEIRIRCTDPTRRRWRTLVLDFRRGEDFLILLLDLYEHIRERNPGLIEELRRRRRLPVVTG